MLFGGIPTRVGTIPLSAVRIEGGILDDTHQYGLGRIGRNDIQSFAQQMTTALEYRPNAILFTARSAVPLADSVRGFYDEAGITLPLLSYIMPLEWGSLNLPSEN